MSLRGHLGVVKPRVVLLVVEEDRADDLELTGVSGEILLFPIGVRMDLVAASSFFFDFIVTAFRRSTCLPFLTPSLATR